MQTLVRLTAAGRRTLADIHRGAERHVAEKLSPLAAAERGQLMSVLKRLTAVLGASDAARLVESEKSGTLT